MGETAKITALRPVGRRKLRIVVWVDDEPWAELDAETIVREQVGRGQVLDAAARDRLLAADATVRARKAAAGYCARLPRTRRELERYLEDRGFKPPAVEAALAALEASGTLDTTGAARAIVRRRRRAGQGPRRIRSELIARGVTPAEAAAHVAEATEGVDVRAECLEQARRVAARYRPLGDARQRGRLAGWLLRRGYEGEMVREVVAELAGEANEVPEPG